MKNIRSMGARALAVGSILAAGVITSAAPTTAAPASGGPIMLAGHDADDHGFVSVYAGLFNDLLSNVGNGGAGILAIGADPGGSSANWISAVGAAMATPQSVTLVNDAAISTIDLTGFAIVFVPSDDLDTFGGISQSENNLLAARSNDIAAFVNAGGGLFGLTQGEFTNEFAYLGGVGGVTTLHVDPSGSLPSGNLYDDVSPTAEGNALGITETNIDGCCWHNVFTAFPSFLQVLAVAHEPDDAAFANQAAVIGGQRVVISTPGRMNGGGSISSDVRHGFTLNCDASTTPNQLEVNWPGGRFKLETLTSASCADDPSIVATPPRAAFDTYTGAGVGRYNGVPGATAEWVFTDAGEPGRSDTATIVVKDASGATVLSVSGSVRGNHQALD